MNKLPSTCQELAEWIAQGDAEAAKEQAERRERERQFNRSFNFEHAKFEFKRALYARAINS
jgi:hypothetical protein